MITPARTVTAAPELLQLGRPAAILRQEALTTCQQMVEHFAGTVATAEALSGDSIDGEVAIITRVRLELAATMHDGTQRPREVRAATGGGGDPGARRQPDRDHPLRRARRPETAFDRIGAHATDGGHRSMVDIAGPFLDRRPHHLYCGGDLCMSLRPDRYNR
ncbi:hypothetical protein [Nocardia jinanensis]|uniref:Uncharacterized protein n=1 Tax=Nocardia jinanensis TaxID=382504 RepID=A0A917VSA5_9NOCA|nr:hypothetical protein [Nocardia jinanensis]GGL12788.1 hypothetical protein GCM10011588_29040 [Nocardia jinanensis]